MRTNCKHYESRTYPSGEVVRRCKLDLAPEAPWRCPEDCPSFVMRLADAAWVYGSLAESAQGSGVPEPVGVDIAALLDEAEDIINSAAPEILEEFASKPRKGLFGGRARATGKGKKRKRK